MKPFLNITQSANDGSWVHVKGRGLDCLPNRHSFLFAEGETDVREGAPCKCGETYYHAPPKTCDKCGQKLPAMGKD